MDTSTILDTWLRSAPDEKGGAPRAFTLEEIEALEAKGSIPLQSVLDALDAQGSKIRGARGNTARDILELLDAVREQHGVSKAELARRAGVARQHLHELLRDPSPNPHLGTVLRLAAVLGFPLEIEAVGESKADRQPRRPKGAPEAAAGPRASEPTNTQNPGPASPEALPRSSTTPRVTPAARIIDEADTLRSVTSFGVGVTVGSVVPVLTGDRGATLLGCGVAGGAALGLGLASERGSTARNVLATAGGGLLLGAALTWLCSALTDTDASRRRSG